MFRFQIRDLCWLTILAAVLVTWWIQWRASEQARLRDAETIQTLKSQAASIRIIRIPANSRQQRMPGSWDILAPPERPRQIDDGWLKELELRQ